MDKRIINVDFTDGSYSEYVVDSVNAASVDKGFLRIVTQIPDPAGKGALRDFQILYINVNEIRFFSIL